MMNRPPRLPPPARFVVYHVVSTMEKGSFYLERAAKIFVASLGKDYAYASVEHYKTKVVHMVKRKNLMSGVEYEEPSNTPSYCSPASEAYWSM